MIEIILPVCMSVLIFYWAVFLSRYLAKTMMVQVDERYELRLRTTLFELEQQLTKVESYLYLRQNEEASHD